MPSRLDIRGLSVGLESGEAVVEELDIDSPRVRSLGLVGASGRADNRRPGDSGLRREGAVHQVEP